jgi:hypothetical protein
LQALTKTAHNKMLVRANWILRRRFMLISLCGIYGRDGNRWLQRFNGAWQVLLERLTGRIIAKKKGKSQYLRESGNWGGASTVIRSSSA